MIANVEAVKRVVAVVGLSFASMGSVLAAPSAAASAPAAATPATPGQARLEDFRLLAISPSEGVAVLRGPDRRLVTLKVGSTLPSARARLAQVTGDRLRFEAVDDKGVPQTVWMIRPADPEQAPEVQRASRLSPATPNMSRGSSVVVPLSPSSSSSPK
jgi:hypothetical protein